MTACVARVRQQRRRPEAGSRCLRYSGPSGGATMKDSVETVIIEELEMGLHPEAITGVMFSIMDLIKRGYKVVISTHSLHVVEIIWAIEEIKKSGVDLRGKLMAFNKLFKIDKNSQGVQDIAEGIFNKEYKVFYFKPGEKTGQTESIDITGLDPSALDPSISGWGGLTEFSSNVVDVVAGVAGMQGME